MTTHTRSRALVLVAVLVAGGTSAAASASARAIEVSQATEMTPVIVELAGEPVAYDIARAKKAGSPLTAAEVQQRRAGLASVHERFLSSLAAAGVAARVRSATVPTPDGTVVEVPFRYTLVLNGLALELPRSALPALSAMPSVKAVHRNVPRSLTTDHTVEHLRATDLYGATREVSPGTGVGVDGFEGQGMHIAVIDSGIEWQHEMFGGDPTPPRLGVLPDTGTHNKKVVYAMSLADQPDPAAHGTHVASIAAGYRAVAPGGDGLRGTGDDVAVHGVAPQARLMSYRVCVVKCDDPAMVMAFEDAVSPFTTNGHPKPVADVVNISIAGPGGPDDILAVAADNAVRAGAVVVGGAGNDGTAPGALRSPAAGVRVIAAAASEDPWSHWTADVLSASAIDPSARGAVTPASGFAPAGDEPQGIRLFPMLGAGVPGAGSLAQYLVYVADGRTLADWPAAAAGRIAVTPDNDGRSAVVARNAWLAGAVALVRVQDDPAIAGGVPIPAATLPPAAGGDQLLALISGDPERSPTQGQLSRLPVRLNPQTWRPHAVGIANFSSRGPVRGLGQVKPDLAAHGVNVLGATVRPGERSAANGSNGHYGFGESSGTSQAAPHIAGAAALLRQARPDWSPDMVRTALINTATNVRGSDGSAKADGVESVLDQGGGLMDVSAAVATRALMGVAGDGIEHPEILGSHSFGATPATGSYSVPVTIRSFADEWSVYRLNVVGDRGVGSPGVDVSVTPAAVAVPPGGAATFTAALTIDVAQFAGSPPDDAQWYVVAEPVQGGARLRMPFYARIAPLPPAAEGASDLAIRGGYDPVSVLPGGWTDSLVVRRRSH